MQLNNRKPLEGDSCPIHNHPYKGRGLTKCCTRCAFEEYSKECIRCRIKFMPTRTYPDRCIDCSMLYPEKKCPKCETIKIMARDATICNDCINRLFEEKVILRNIQLGISNSK